jgi:threonine/homoserine/homoserine lactone efflux protein
MALGLIEILFSGGVVLVWCAYQLWSLRRDTTRESQRDSTKNAGHPERQHELDEG